MNLPEGATPVERISVQANPSIPCLALHLARYAFAARHILEGENVLDISCGTGYGTNLLSSVPARVTGVDLDEQAVREARAHHGKSEHPDGQVTFVQAEMLDYLDDFNDCTFDVVVSFETLEHVDDLRAALAQILRVYTRKALICVPYNEPKGSWIFHKHFELTPAVIEDMVPTGHRVEWYIQALQPFCQITAAYSAQSLLTPSGSISNIIAVITRA